MVEINKLGILLTKTDNSFESEGVLNPAVIKVGNTIHLLYRAVAKDNYSTIGYCQLSSPMVVQSRNDAPLLCRDLPSALNCLVEQRFKIRQKQNTA